MLKCLLLMQLASAEEEQGNLQAAVNYLRSAQGRKKIILDHGEI